MDNTTNRVTGPGVVYDSNGNLQYGFAGLTFGYDTANRVTEVINSTGDYYYAYDSDNRRIYYRDNNNNETIYFYGADGRKTSSYTMTVVSNPNSIQMNPAPGGGNVYFAGILLMEDGSSVRTDRLGSVRWGGPNSLGYQAQYPYGVEYTTTANDREKYATYTRDSDSGMDYAMNRYYSSQWGRFLSADPSGGSIDATSPQSWNRYGYGGNDPVNNVDPSGLTTAQGCINDPDSCTAQDWEPPFACDLFGGCQPGCPSDANGNWNGFLPMPGPYGPICPFAAAPALPKYSANCVYTLEYRPVEPNPQPGLLGLILEGFNHSYLDVQITTTLSYGGTSYSTSSEFVMEGMPQHPNFPFGNLVGLQEPVINGVVQAPPGFPVSLDHPLTDERVGSIRDNCQHLIALEASAKAFPTNIPYNPAPPIFWFWPGENSNFYAWALTSRARPKLCPSPLCHRVAPILI